MGRIVVTEFVSLDGVFESPGPAGDFEHAGWTFRFNRGADGDTFKFDEHMAAEAQLLGRVTYEGFAAAWPSVTDDVGFADRMNSMPKYVVSATLEKAEWNNSTVIGIDDVARVRDSHRGDLAGRGQRRPGARAARAQARGRGSADGVPHRAGQRAAAVRWRAADPVHPREQPAGRAGRRAGADLPSGLAPNAAAARAGRLDTRALSLPRTDSIG